MAFKADKNNKSITDQFQIILEDDPSKEASGASSVLEN